MNVDLAESDWGTVVQRRVRQEPVEQGGWSVFHTYGSSLAYLNPAVSSLVKGPGRSGWFGWYESPRMQELVQAWLDAPDAERQRSLANEINKLAQRSEEHTSELQSRQYLVCRLLLEKKTRTRLDLRHAHFAYAF